MKSPADVLLLLLTRRRHAEQALREPGLILALDELRTRARKQIEESEPEARDVREHAYAFLRALKALEQQLALMIAQHKVEEKKQDPERVKPGISL
jgi:hypothetical protein